jgi:hypothetical protein
MKLGATPTREDAEAYAEFVAKEAQTKAKADVLEPLGFKDDAELVTNLKAASQQIKDGKQYREDLLSQLHANTIKLEGNDEAGIKAADRVKKVYETADLEMIKAENARLETRIATLIPSGQQSQSGSQEENKTQYFDTSNYG